MIVQSSDGWFYLNPVIIGPNFVLKCHDDIEYTYVGPSKNKNVKWATAVKPLRPAGIWAKLKDKGFPSRQSVVIDGVYKEGTGFFLTLTRPIPAPTSFEAKFPCCPAPGDFEIIAFNEKGKKLEQKDAFMQLGDPEETRVRSRSRRMKTQEYNGKTDI